MIYLTHMPLASRMQTRSRGTVWTPLSILFLIWALPVFVFAQGNEEDFVAHGIQKAQNGDLDGAISDFTRGIELDPKDSNAYFNRGIAKSRKGDLDAAISDFDRSIAIDPMNSAAFVGRGFAAQQKQNLAAALADYNRAIELDPNDANTYNNRGVVKLSKLDQEGALADFSRSIELNPKGAPPYGNRGILFLVRGDLSASLTDLRQKCKLEQNQDYTHLYIWLVRTQQNEHQHADDELAEYLKNRTQGAADDWPVKLANFLLGKISEQEFLAGVSSSDAKRQSARRCEAYFFAGMKRLVQADKTNAADYFRKCVATNEKTYKEYALAQAELKVLDK